MSQLVKICPRCGEEYVPTTERCIDCGLPLVLEGDAPGTAAPAPLAEERGTELDPADLVLVREAEIAWARRLAAALEAAGVPCRAAPIAAPGSGAQGAWSGRWGVYVRRDDAGVAAEVDAARLREEIPDLGGEAAHGGAAPESACPGCGHELASDAEECPECGLAFA
jgi:hypothetical protein